jgi:hypothetical protein
MGMTDRTKPMKEKPVKTSFGYAIVDLECEYQR